MDNHVSLLCTCLGLSWTLALGGLSCAHQHCSVSADALAIWTVRRCKLRLTVMPDLVYWYVWSVLECVLWTLHLNLYLDVIFCTVHKCDMKISLVVIPYNKRRHTHTNTEIKKENKIKRTETIMYYIETYLPYLCYKNFPMFAEVM